jgi:hypothetical protein
MRLHALILAACLAAAGADDRLLYADFETPMDQRPTSARGGWLGTIVYQENAQNPAQFAGAPGIDPPSPALKATAQDGSNHAVAFEYEFKAPNQWAGVGVEIHGRPDVDGKPQADDVSGYKHLRMQLYTPEVTNMRVEFMSRGYGNDQQVYPQFTFRTKPGFHTYEVHLSDAIQPPWVETKINPKEVFRTLTSVTVVAYCDDCRATKGLVVVDNVAFEN